MTKTLLLTCCLLMLQPVAAQTCKDTILTSTPDSQFYVVGDEVTDTKTGLIWQRCSLGQTGNDCSGGSANTYDWQQALQAAEDIRLNTGQPWRLPNLNELESILEESCFDPTINLTIFPNTSAAFYWSSSSYANNRHEVWRVNFYNGNSASYNKSNNIRIRLVRGGL